MNAEELRSWVGREQTLDDVAVSGPLDGLAALLDHSQPPWLPSELPPLAHWLYFQPHAKQSALDQDGHPRRGDFLPPVPLPRRMWVGSRIIFQVPIPLGADIHRRSTIASVSAKDGRTGPLVFVTVKHEVTVAQGVAIIEEQDIVYRAAMNRAGKTPEALPATPVPERAAQARRRFVPDPTHLFRFSALTFNAHRIHYDRDYARDIEGYPGLVVQGPLVAILLMDHYLRTVGPQRVREFSFRAGRPLFDTAPFDLCSAPGDGCTDMWAVVGGTTAFSASVWT
jgi:3-methylfumaryl-CoA hydratase